MLVRLDLRECNNSGVKKVKFQIYYIFEGVYNYSILFLFFNYFIQINYFSIKKFNSLNK